MKTKPLRTTLRFTAAAAIAAISTFASAQQPTLPSTPVQLQSVNIPNNYVRHRNGVAVLTTVASNLDKQDSSFMLRPGLAGSGVSFESVNFPGAFLRHSSGVIRLGKLENSDLYKKDATFVQRNGLAGKGASFESINFPGFFLRHCNSTLFIDNAKGANKACAPDLKVASLDASFELVGAVSVPHSPLPIATPPTPVVAKPQAIVAALVKLPPANPKALLVSQDSQPTAKAKGQYSLFLREPDEGNKMITHETCFFRPGAITDTRKMANGEAWPVGALPCNSAKIAEADKWWEYDPATRSLKSLGNQQCLTLSPDRSNGESFTSVGMSPCNPKDPLQKVVLHENGDELNLMMEQPKAMFRIPPEFRQTTCLSDWGGGQAGQPRSHAMVGCGRPNPWDSGDGGMNWKFRKK